MTMDRDATADEADRSGAGDGGTGGGELRAIADRLLAIMDELRRLEEHKRSEELGSEEFVALAEEAETQGRLVFRWTGMQLELARESAQRRLLGQVEPSLRIVDIEPRPMDVILAAWREAQIRLEIARPGSTEASEAADTIERLRDEYRSATSAKADTAADLRRHPGARGSAR